MKKALVLCYLFLSTCFSQGQDLIDITKGESVSRARFVKNPTKTYYFPFTLSPDSSVYVGLNPFWNERYSEVLAVLNEPVIYHNQSDTVIYRFTWLRAFHAPVVIRLEGYKGRYQLIWKAYDKASGSRLLDRKTWNMFVKQLTRADFWQLPADEDVIGVDGSRWLLEGKLPGRYHVVNRFTPKPDSAYYQCCDLLIRLTGLQFTDREKY